MGSLSNYLEGKVIDHLLRNQAYTPATTLYLALYTVTPGDAGGGTEVTGGAYARQSVALNASGGVGVTANTSDITFPQASADWGELVAVGIFDDISAGNLLAWGALSPFKTVNSGDTFKVLAGDLDITVD